MVRRSVVPLVAVLILIAGCSSSQLSSDPTTSSSTAANATFIVTSTDGCSTAGPAPPENFSTESARTYAEKSERILVYNRLCKRYSEFGLSGGTASQESFVEYQTGDKAFVFVQQPFWYAYDNISSDGASRAVYFVRPNAQSRVSLSDTEDGFFEPYYGGTSDENVPGKDIRILNFDDDTVSVDTTIQYEDGDTSEVVYDRNLSVRPTGGIEFSRAIHRTGNYTLSVSGATFQRTEKIELTEGDDFSFIIYLGPRGGVSVGKGSPSWR